MERRLWSLSGAILTLENLEKELHDAAVAPGAATNAAREDAAMVTAAMTIDSRDRSRELTEKRWTGMGVGVASACNLVGE